METNPDDVKKDVKPAGIAPDKATAGAVPVKKVSTKQAKPKAKATAKAAGPSSPDKPPGNQVRRDQPANRVARVGNQVATQQIRDRPKVKGTVTEPKVNRKGGLKWDESYGRCYGMPGRVYCQKGKYFDNDGKAVK